MDILGSHKIVPDDVRERTVAKVGKLGRLAPLLEQAEVRLTQDRERPAATRWACHTVVTRPRT